MTAVKIKIGSVCAPGAALDLWLSIDDEGVGTIHVYCRELCKADRSGYLILDAAGWAALKELIDRAEATIDRLKQTGQLKYVAEGFQLAGE